MSGCGEFLLANYTGIESTARISPEQGHRFNGNKLLLDPFANAIAGVRDWNFSAAQGYDSDQQG